MALRTESDITQTWPPWGKAFTSTVATRFSITAKAWLITQLAARLAIAATARGDCFGALLTWAIIATDRHHGAWCGFGFGWCSFHDRR